MKKSIYLEGRDHSSKDRISMTLWNSSKIVHSYLKHWTQKEFKDYQSKLP